MSLRTGSGGAARIPPRAAVEVHDLLRRAYAAHEVVATEVRFAGRGFRRTVFALSPTPVALMLLAMRVCATGDDITLCSTRSPGGTTSRRGRGPFGTAEAERLTRPPPVDDDLVGVLADLDPPG